ncbi:MAG TPA: hypothetical protein ENK91_13310 [Bacteroidetes bacterium]|nr:hypothetical protein [Bacteroidota bacterium]
MLGVSDNELESKLVEMGFKPNEGQLEYRSLDCFTPGSDCYIQTGGISVWIEDEHCDNPVRIVVNYSVALCWDGSLNFYDFSLDTIYPCPELKEYMDGLSDHQLSAYLDKLYYKASISLEKIFMLTYLQNAYGATSSFYTNQCYQWCYSVVSKPGDDYIVGYASKVNCGEHCCLRTTFYYWDNGVLKNNDPIFNDSGTSDCATFPIEECRNGRFVGDCDHICGPL